MRAVWAPLPACLAALWVGCADRAPEPPVDSPTTDAFEEPYPPGAPAVSWFREVTAASGVEVSHHVPSDDPTTRLFGAGAAAGDVDGDGQDDLIVALGTAAPRLFVGVGGLQFEDATDGAGLGSSPASSARLVDLDGDAHLDLVLGRDDLVDNPGTIPTVRLYWGHGDGSFTEATEAAGIAARSHTKAVGVRDIDGDGLLDLYIANFAAAPTDLTGRDDELYRNRGDRTFEAIGARLGLDAQGLTWVVAMFDADGDGRPEIFAGNDSFIEDDGSRPIEPASSSWGVVPDLLLSVQGTDSDGYPRADERPDASLNEPRSTMNAIAADFDNDGRLDLYLSDFGRNELLLAQPDGSYADATDAFGLAALSRDDSRCPPGGWDILCLLVSWAAAYEDFDLDGIRDLLVLNGHILTDDGRQPVATWRGLEDSGFEAVQSGLPWLDARSMVAHDFDRDGDLDLVIATWHGPVRVFENQVRSATSTAPHYLALTVAGTSSAQDGSGTRIRVSAGGHAHTVELGTGGMPYSAHPTQAHLGLGDAISADLEITWPTGLVQRLTLGANQETTVVEPRLYELSARVLPGDGVSTAEVRVIPRGADGLPLGPGQNVEVTATLGTWSGPVVDNGDGTYRRTLTAPPAPGLAAITIAIDGVPLHSSPRVTFQ